MSMRDYEFWFVVGSQFLYGDEVLETVEARAKEMCEKMNAGGCCLQAGVQDHRRHQRRHHQGDEAGQQR